MQAPSVDIETKILNDLDERIHGITQMGVERPELIKVVSNVPSDYSSPDVPFAYHTHVFHMRVVSDNEWNGWLRWMKSAFEQGTIAAILILLAIVGGIVGYLMWHTGVTNAKNATVIR